MAKIRWHGSRSLLNLPGHETTAAIVAELENTSRWPKGKHRSGKALNEWNARPDYILQFSDCTRSINFTVDFGSPEVVDNSVHKLNTMIDALTKFRDGYVVEAQRYNDREDSFVADGEGF